MATAAIDLDELIECAPLADDIVGHPLTDSIAWGANLQTLRDGSRSKATERAIVMIQIGR